MISRQELELEINKLREQEQQLDAQLRQYFVLLNHNNSGNSSGNNSGNNGSSKAKISKGGKGTALENADLLNHCQKIERFAPCFEAMCEDARKLSIQVEDCRSLSDRISLLVRKLDSKQMRAQQALACAEDIINLKDCKIKLLSAIEDNNLPLAVSFIRQVHDIDQQAASASDDYVAIQEAEGRLRVLVQEEFDKAIAQNDTNRVMMMCPLFQTLGLETAARDSFLTYVEQTVFTSVSADAPVDGADPATAYAQSLSNIFNNTYSIFQQYLPMIIQGMESSLGDVYFIRKMHQKCEREAAIVLKRYMKFRNLKEMISGLKSSSAKHPTAAELHVILDEVALLLQYCCLYSKYVQQLCTGAELRARKPSTTSAGNAVVTQPFTVFPSGGTQFDRMVEEVVNQYYMEGEQWLMSQGAKIMIIRNNDGLPSIREDVGLDECFFVLRRCGQRAIATNNIHVACAVINVISNLLSTSLLGQLNELLAAAIAKVVATVQEQLARFLKPNYSSTPASSLTSGSESFSLGIKSAMSMATSLTATKSSSQASKSVSVTQSALSAEESDRILDHVEEDPYGLSNWLQCFNLIEMSVRYTDRLTREIQQTSGVVFAAVSLTVGKGSSDNEKVKMSIDTLDGAKLQFLQALRKGCDRLAGQLQPTMKEVLMWSLGHSGPLGGIRWDITDDKFDAQGALTLLPRAVVAPFETMIIVSTTSLSENNKDMIIGVFADACCERLEHFISQHSFRFAGALKMEECVRALASAFAKASGVPIRGKFSRLREIMLVLTSDVNSFQVDNSATLTPSEVHAFLSLRADANNQ